MYQHCLICSLFELLRLLINKSFCFSYVSTTKYCHVDITSIQIFSFVTIKFNVNLSQQIIWANYDKGGFFCIFYGTDKQPIQYDSLLSNFEKKIFKRMLLSSKINYNLIRERPRSRSQGLRINHVTNKYLSWSIYLWFRLDFIVRTIKNLD